MLSEKEQPVGEITVRPMEKHEWRAVVDVLARALRDNPTSVGMFGPDEDRRLRSLRALYGALLDDAPLPPLVACSDRRILGAAAVFPPGSCLFRRAQARVRRLRLPGRDIHVESPWLPWGHLPGLLRVGPAALGRAAVMARVGEAHDPEDRHWHVELVGVEPALQGRGIGRMLMEAALRQADAADEPAYLETDTPENVEFYRRRGFEVTGQEEPLGVRTWYMQRAPRWIPAT
ncbi:MAG TPA: GNAT family N-acetyltransferase [Chloroflexota bacterium]|nr:GNAT family N-acetyltransferase [Chloroflexota bacterium]